MTVIAEIKTAGSKSIQLTARHEEEDPASMIPVEDGTAATMAHAHDDRNMLV